MRAQDRGSSRLKVRHSNTCLLTSCWAHGGRWNPVTYWLDSLGFSVYSRLEWDAISKNTVETTRRMTLKVDLCPPHLITPHKQAHIVDRVKMTKIIADMYESVKELKNNFMRSHINTGVGRKRVWWTYLKPQHWEGWNRRMTASSRPAQATVWDLGRTKKERRRTRIKHKNPWEGFLNVLIKQRPR